MKKDDFYEEDDGRTIADMSGIERQPTFLPHFHRKRSDFSAPDALRANDRPWESAAGELTREERNAAIRGALKAGLLIAGVYILAAAALIVAMQLLWSYIWKKEGSFESSFFIFLHGQRQIALFSSDFRLFSSLFYDILDK